VVSDERGEEEGREGKTITAKMKVMIAARF
jgi:hypothetical protein